MPISCCGIFEVPSMAIPRPRGDRNISPKLYSLEKGLSWGKKTEARKIARGENATRQPKDG